MMRSLLKDVSVSELLRMREDGMTNREIADALDVSYKAVLAAIGKQPKELRKKPEFHTPVLPPPTYASEPASRAEEEIASASLVVANKYIELAGLFGNYSIPIHDRVVNINTSDHGSMQVPFDKLDDFILELQAIQRKVPSLVLSTEMW